LELRLLVPEAKSFASTSATRIPRNAASRKMDVPVIPRQKISEHIPKIYGLLLDRIIGKFGRAECRSWIPCRGFASSLLKNSLSLWERAGEGAYGNLLDEFFFYSFARKPSP